MKLRKIALFVAALTLTLTLVSCGAFGEKTYTTGRLSITLKGFFTEQSDLVESYDLILISPDTGVMILQETYDEFEQAGMDTNMTVLEYAELIMSANQFPGEPVQEDGMTYFTYTKSTDGTDFTYMSFCYRDIDAYWLVQLYCTSEDFETKKPTLMEWARSVSFGE